METTPSVFKRTIYGSFLPDIGASVVVFLVALPLCMGIAVASGMPASSGLITGLVGGIIVGYFGGSPLQVSGPAAGLSVIVFELVHEHGMARVGAIVLIAGLIQLVAGIFRIGRWFQAVSPELIHGMLAGIGVLIILQQFQIVLDRAPARGGLHNMIAFGNGIFGGIFPLDGSKEEAASFLGLITLGVLLVWERYKPRALKLVPGALLGIMVATVCSIALHMDVRKVTIPTNISTLVHAPSLSSVTSMPLSTLIAAAASLAFIASAETLLSATAVDHMQSRVRTDYNRELRAQGMGNMLCGLVGALPMTGVIVRSSANVLAGAQTKWSSIMHGLWILAAMAVFPKILNLIPTSALAAVLVYVGFKLIKPSEVIKLRRFGWMPGIIFLICMGTIIFTDLLTGVLTGFVLSTLHLLYRLTHFSVHTETLSAGSVLSLKGNATFLSIPRLAHALDGLPEHGVLVFEAAELNHIDHACLDLIERLIEVRQQRGGEVYIDSAMSDLMRHHASVAQLSIITPSMLHEKISHTHQPRLQGVRSAEATDQQ